LVSCTFYRRVPDEVASETDAILLTETSFDYQLALLGGDGTAFQGDDLALASAGRDCCTVLAATRQDDPTNAVLVPVVGR
jgi:hypothetical protein